LIASSSRPNRQTTQQACCPKAVSQSTLCDLSFFVWSYERNTPIVPDTLKESVLPSATRLEFISRQDRINFPPELPLELPYGFRQGFATRGADHQHIDVASSILLVSRERPVEIGFLDALNCFDGLCNQRRRTDSFRNDATDLKEEPRTPRNGGPRYTLRFALPNPRASSPGQ